MPIHGVSVCRKDVRSSLPLYFPSSSSLDSLFRATSYSWAGMGLSMDPWRFLLSWITQIGRHRRWSNDSQKASQNIKRQEGRRSGSSRRAFDV